MAVQDKICMSSSKAVVISIFLALVVTTAMYIVYKTSIIQGLNKNLAVTGKPPGREDNILKNISEILKKPLNINVNALNKENVYPERNYVHSRSIENTSRNIGYVYSDTQESQKFPLYEQVLDRRYYYHINYYNQGSPVPINIPLETRNNNELYDGQVLNIPEILSGASLTVKLYSQQLRYY